MFEGFAIDTARPLLVLSCSDVKRPVDPGALVRFGDLYDGPMWRQVRASGFPLSNVAAISALYGYLEPGFPVRTYDRVMDDDRMSRMISTGDDVYRLSRQAASVPFAFVVGGLKYQELARAAERRDNPKCRGRFLYADGSYLRQRKQLGEFLRENAR